MTAVGVQADAVPTRTTHRAFNRTRYYHILHPGRESGTKIISGVMDAVLFKHDDDALGAKELTSRVHIRA